MSSEQEKPSEPQRLYSDEEYRRIADEGLVRARQFLWEAHTQPQPRTQRERTEQREKRHLISWIFPELLEDVKHEIAERKRVALEEIIGRQEQELAERLTKRQRGKRRLPEQGE